MKNSLRTALVGAAAAVVFSSTVWYAGAQAPAAGAPPRPAQPRRAAAAAAAAAATPARHADPAAGRRHVNLGRVPGEKGTWSVPYITNMAMRVVRSGQHELLPEIVAQQAAAAAARAGGAGARGGGGGGGGRGGSKSEPWMPWMPWSAAVYDYNSKNESKYDPEGYCLPPGGPRMMATPYQAEIIQLPEQKRIIMIFEGATHIWREIYMDGRAVPRGRRAQPDLPRLLGRPLGRRHARRREQGLQREQLARLLRPSAHRQDGGRPSGGRGRTRDRCATRRRSTIRAPTRGRSPCVGHSTGTRRPSCPSTSARRTTSTCNRLVDDLGQRCSAPRQPGVKPAAAGRGTR